MTLVVDSASVDVTLRAADVEEIVVHTDLRISSVGAEKAEGWIEAHMPRFAATEDELKITASPGKSGFLGLGHLTARARLRIVAPAGVIPDLTSTSGTIRVGGDFAVAGPLMLRTASGAIELDGGARSVDIRSPSGDVHVKVLRPLDRFFARTASGDITLAGGSREATVETSSGNVWLANLSGPTTVESSTGRITLKWDRLDSLHTVKVVSSSGRVHMSFPETSRPQGTIVTNGGAIRCDLPGTLADEGDSVQLDGDGPTIEVRTASGHIIVDHSDE
jgi:hypothetical protein